MNIFDKIRIKRKIRKLCTMMCSVMNEDDVIESVCNIKNTLRKLPNDRKEGLLDACLKVLGNEC